MEVYGEDAPKGKALVGSKLNSKTEITIPMGLGKSFTIKNTSGNTGCFINAIELTGSNAEHFMIASKIQHILLTTGKEMAIYIRHTGTSAHHEASLKIIYNGDQQLNIKLNSK
jgi:hypothetical protein